MSLESRLNSVRRIGLDSSIFIYYAEAHDVFGPVSREIFKSAELNNLKLFASTLVLTEVLTGYRRSGDFVAEDTFWNIFRAAGHILSFEPLTVPIADRSASLRVSYTTLKTPDAIHIATAISAGSEVYITNDRKLKTVKEIPILLLSEF